MSFLSSHAQGRDACVISSSSRGTLNSMVVTPRPPRRTRTTQPPAAATLSSVTFGLLQRVGCYNLLFLYCLTMACAVWSVWKLAIASLRDDDRSLLDAPQIGLPRTTTEPDADSTTTQQHQQQPYYFHRMRPDRSGAVIHDMLIGPRAGVCGESNLRWCVYTGGRRSS